MQCCLYTVIASHVHCAKVEIAAFCQNTQLHTITFAWPVRMVLLAAMNMSNVCASPGE